MFGGGGGVDNGWNYFPPHVNTPGAIVQLAPKRLQVVMFKLDMNFQMTKSLVHL